jgi:hypothetical protein
VLIGVLLGLIVGTLTLVATLGRILDVFERRW